MTHTQNDLNKGDSYRGFDVVDCVDVSDYSAAGIWLRHRKTGLEVFHLQCADEENLFAFAFKTPPKDSTGVAHILEHSVLCGSERFPLKDPFLRLANQSVKTFLNAMTFPDKTVYPASSISETDYFNLMDVYGDAVFFPLLKEWTFAQEGHRLELDDSGAVSLQGVVYNEMKGCYSSFDTIAADKAVRSVLPHTVYDLDSGGDPAEIPLLTYEAFCAFHREQYAPDKCLLFLYGNIPTRRQLDFIQERFLDRFEQRGFVPASVSGAAAAARTLSSAGADFAPPEPFKAPVYREFPAPAAENGNDGATVTVTWFTGDSSDPVQFMETVFLSEVLMGHDGSPLVKALLESELGDDIAPNYGVDGEMHWTLLTAGLRGVPRGKAAQVESVITGVLENLCSGGIDAADIEAAVMSVDFSQREVRRSGGPYSLILMRRCLRGWLYGKPPYHTISNRRAFDEVKKRISSDPDYVCALIRRLLLENAHRSLVCVYPDESFTAEREAAERRLAERLARAVPEESIRRAQTELHRIQQTADSAEACALIPHIKPSDLTVKIDRIETVRTVCAAGVPLFLNTEPTNGIVYLEAGFPVDSIAPADLPLLPLFAAVVTNVGFGGKSWAQSAAQVALKTGGFGASLFTSGTPESALSADPADPVIGRSWLFFRVKMLTEYADDALALLADCLRTPDFSDVKRLRDLAAEFRNDMIASVIPSGNEYAASRASCRFSPSKALDEIWNGLSQVFTAQRLADAEPDFLPRAFGRIMAALRRSGTVLHVTADEPGVLALRQRLDAFAAACDLLPPSAPVPYAAAELYALTDIPASAAAYDGESCSISDSAAGASHDAPVSHRAESGGRAAHRAAHRALEQFTVSAQVGFAAAACKASAYGSKEAVHDSVFAHWLTNSVLWERIRTVGGAYGAFAWSDAIERVFTFASYRDPKPLHSLDVFSQCLTEASDTLLDGETLERIVTGCYSKEVQPRSPSSRGFTGFLRCLYALTDDQRERKIKWLLSVSASDVKAAAIRLSAAETECTRAIICGKNTEKTGKIIDLPV
ncbi:insulinase family protein [Treponema brennaborense]|uniref:Peptidase M16C associated domain protein n=1 Tax=Treponema brennaborense (strain DSM 12168 / CIP 105900 / DD5/3) TaxID=906968 RepID=F4LNR4_TREBD|nr:insulinase family protein [Treponema brennaborense]AEE16899.1 Peptidase M16C associated domain protein [Treponema brennaborense DSM 12168]